MIRILEVKLPIDHVEAALTAAILAKLGIPPEDLLTTSIYKRSYDSRRKTAPRWVYIVDVQTRQDARLLKRLRNDPHITETPDMSYRMVARPPPPSRRARS